MFAMGEILATSLSSAIVDCQSSQTMSGGHCCVISYTGNKPHVLIEHFMSSTDINKRPLRRDLLNLGAPVISYSRKADPELAVALMEYGTIPLEKIQIDILAHGFRMRSTLGLILKSERGMGYHSVLTMATGPLTAEMVRQHFDSIRNELMEVALGTEI